MRACYREVRVYDSGFRMAGGSWNHTRASTGVILTAHGRAGGEIVKVGSERMCRFSVTTDTVTISP